MLKNDTSTTTVFIYDLSGNMIGEYDTSGNMIADYVYLGGHRLAKIQASPGGGGGGGCQQMQSLPSGGDLKQALQNNWALMLVMPMLIALGVRHRKDKFVVFGLAIIGAGSIILLMSTESRSQSPTEAMYYYHNDHLGTPLKMTDEDGDVAWDGVYKPFGELFSTPVADIQNNFRFPGQYDDLITGLYYNYNRYYIPTLGRYNRVDPVEGGNPYVYAANNPNQFVDPEGLSFYTNSSFLIDWVLGFGTQYRYYDENTVEGIEMKNSPGAGRLRDFFYGNKCKDGCNSGYDSFTAANETLIHPCSTGAQVAGFGPACAINIGNNKVLFAIWNTAGMNSFFYHRVSDKSSPSGPMSNIYQLFEWSEDIDKCKCSK